jgi:hypothetical protein
MPIDQLEPEVGLAPCRRTTELGSWIGIDAHISALALNHLLLLWSVPLSQLWRVLEGGIPSNPSPKSGTGGGIPAVVAELLDQSVQ